MMVMEEQTLAYGDRAMAIGTRHLFQNLLRHKTLLLLVLGKPVIDLNRQTLMVMVKLTELFGDQAGDIGGF